MVERVVERMHEWIWIWIVMMMMDDTDYYYYDIERRRACVRADVRVCLLVIRRIPIYRERIQGAEGWSLNLVGRLNLILILSSVTSGEINK